MRYLIVLLGLLVAACDMPEQSWPRYDIMCGSMEFKWVKDIHFNISKHGTSILYNGQHYEFSSGVPCMAIRVGRG
jgi:hypothetical protein